MRPALVGALALAAAARAEEPWVNQQADARFKQGILHFEINDYEAAIREFSAAYELRPLPKYLFSWAQAERLSGDCPSALPLYRKYIETGPEPRKVNAVQGLIRRCERALATRPETVVRVPPEPAPVEAPPPVEAPAPPPVEAPASISTAPTTETAPLQVERERPRERWTRDYLGHALSGAGVVALGVGVGFLVAWRNDRDAEADAPTYGEYDDIRDRAVSHERIAIVGLTAGGLLVAAGLVRYLSD